VLHADDTTLPVLAPGTGKTRTGRLWVVVRDERPFGSDNSAGRLLSLLAGPQGHPRPGAARPLPRLPSLRMTAFEATGSPGAHTPYQAGVR
jgi:hypothetical protein